jgi:hypothetical protein
VTAQLTVEPAFKVSLLILVTLWGKALIADEQWSKIEQPPKKQGPAPALQTFATRGPHGAARA